uniref:Uncharacterized protein n=1 Tax=Arundo donax TaxID=35708 RepID=A0A0A9GUQ1_ARUDO
MGLKSGNQWSQVLHGYQMAQRHSSQAILLKLVALVSLEPSDWNDSCYLYYLQISFQSYHSLFQM